MPVRAKFQCSEIAKRASWGNGPHETDQVTLVAVSNDQNKTWSKWTPSGKIEMQINNPDALNQFSIGSFYFVDFTEAPAAEADEKR